MRWIKPTPNDGQARHIARQFGISPVVAAILTGRGLTEYADLEEFLNPRLQGLRDPLLLGNMPEAVNRLEEALQRQESILIFGDYDVDGVTSTVLLTQFLRSFGLSPRFVVPRRMEEGYGLGIESLERALSDGKPDLLIAVDCGTSSAVEVEWLRRQGISVLILDHHTSKESLPQDCILVNPHVHDDPADPWRHLCSAGLVFKFCHAFLKIMRQKGDPVAGKIDLRQYLDLVAMGTVADLVHLTGENRILVKNGLQRLRTCRRPGVCALMEVAGITLGDDISPFDIGFRLGPRINASGRLDDASVPIQLLLCESWKDCQDTAQMLDSSNRERQEIERAITEEAERQVLEQFMESKGLILHSQDWHAGVVGIVASRISRKFNKPTLILGSDAGGLVKGSGRSIEGVDLVSVLQECTEHMIQWGGHPMAVGLSAEEERLGDLRKAFDTAISDRFPEGLPEPKLLVDTSIDPGDLTEGLLRELDHLAPYGQGNPEPVFSIHGARIANLNPLGKDHLRFGLVVPGRQRLIDGVAWNMGDIPPPAGIPFDLAVRFHWHSWRGRRSPRLTLLDWRPARESSPKPA